MKIPSPVECGLPAKFTAWRAKQEEAIDVMITSPKRVVSISAPTGFGKSPAYVAAALLSGKPTCIVTNSRGLQDQLMRDYKSIGLVDIRGRANYRCGLREDYTCEVGYSMGCPYKGSVMCPSTMAEIKAAASSLVVTNYDKWTSSRMFGMGMQHFQQVIFDEGHDAPDALARAMQVHLGHTAIQDELKLDYPLAVDNFGNWKIWAGWAKMEAERMMNETKTKINEVDNPRPSWIKQYFHFRRLVRDLTILSTARPDDWVVDEDERGFQFDPIRPAIYAEGALLLRLPKIIIISATLRPKTMYMLGLPSTEFQFAEYDSDFPPERCPIYWVPTMRVDSRATDMSMLWMRLDQIAARRQDRKGIIHTVSYARRDDILGRSRFASRMMINPKGEPATVMVEQFKKAPPGSILVSPSVGTGYDFPGKDCEWQFICKIPFPDGRSKIVKARQQRDNEYGPYMAMQTLVQAIGRGMRSREDQCESFLPDDHLEWFLPKYRHLAPKSFNNFFRKAITLPQPPEKL